MANVHSTKIGTMKYQIWYYEVPKLVLYIATVQNQIVTDPNVAVPNMYSGDNGTQEDQNEVNKLKNTHCK